MIADYLEELQGILEKIDQEKVSEIVDRLYKAYEENQQVFLVGNGGSASTASHFACDLAKGTIVEGKKRFIVSSLNDNIAIMTALSNDIGYAYVFEEQLKNWIREGDILIAISASGNSENIINGITYAKAKGAFIVGFSGFSGGKLAEMSDLNFHVRSDNYGIVEDVHLMAEHMISQEIRERILKEVMK